MFIIYQVELKNTGCDMNNTTDQLDQNKNAKKIYCLPNCTDVKQLNDSNIRDICMSEI